MGVHDEMCIRDRTHIYLDDTSNITIPEMKAKIRRINQDPARPDIGLLLSLIHI